jgi:hypothetical protein
VQAYAHATPDRAPTVKPAVNSFQLQSTQTGDKTAGSRNGLHQLHVYRLLQSAWHYAVVWSTDAAL